MTTEFDWKGAVLFGGEFDGELEELEYQNLEDYLDYYVNDEGNDYDDGVLVVGYARDPIDWLLYATFAEGAAEGIAEALLTEGHLHPSNSRPAGDFVKRLAPAISAATVRIVREMGGPWSCHEVARRTYTKEEVLAIVVGKE